MGLPELSHRVRYRPKKTWSSKANQKLGIDKPRKAPPVAMLSNFEYWRSAESVPMATPMISEMITPASPRMILFPRACLMSVKTGRELISDEPQSPRTKWDSQAVYC